MADNIYFAPLRTPLIDERTGLMAREWYLFFQALWRRSGGTQGQSNDDLLQSIGMGIGAAEVQQQAASDADALAQTPPPIVVVIPDSLAAELAGLPDQVAEFRKELDGLRQGLAQLI